MSTMHIETAIRVAIVTAALTAFAAPALAQEQQPKSALSREHVQRHAPAASDAKMRTPQDAYAALGYVGASPVWPGDVAMPRASYAYDGFGGPFRDDGAPDYQGAGFNGGRFSALYAARNNFACQPGTLFNGEDGRRHLCQ